MFHGWERFFLRLLNMVVVPLVFVSVVNGVLATGNKRTLSQLGGKTIGLYLLTSLLAIITGVIWVNIIEPGYGVEMGLGGEDMPSALASASPSLWGIFERMIPTNIFSSLAEADMLSIIFFAVILGLTALSLQDEKRGQLTSIFDTLFELMTQMVSKLMIVAPFGVFGLFVAFIAGTGQENLVDVLVGVGLYMLTVILGLLTHAGVNLFLLTKYLGKISPWRFFKVLLSPLLTAFSTASSSATLPLTLETFKEKTQVPKKVSNFVLPLGATVNMDGTALYEGVAVLFIAQVYGVELGLLQQVIVVVTALLASIGAAGIPMAGLVMMSIVMKAVGLPLEGVMLILSVDRILDLMRTAVNVWSDSCVTAIMSQWEGQSALAEKE